jgi:small-conductance mechanosensitive channel
VVYLVFFRLGRQATFWAQSDESLHATARVLQHPLAAAVLVTMIVLGSLFHPTAPAAVINLSGAILLLAVLRLVPHLVRREMRPAIGMLVSLIVLYLVVDLVPNTFLLDRIGMLVLAVAGAASCGWTLRKEFSLDDVRRDGWFWGGTWVAALATVFFAVAAIANTIGAVALASLLSIATLGAIYDAITLWIFALVLFGAVAIALKTTNARRLLIVRYHSDRIQAVLVKAIKVLAVVAWGVYALERFGLLSWARETAERVFFSEYRIGDFSLSVSGVVIFVVVIWFSIKLSQFISFVLDEDVLPRLDLPKGVPATISKTTTYVVVALGVIIAISAAGIDLSKATILVGALGVGIGFGLQNAVNNFVSGLILLFGRPINVGDKIQIDTVSGVVTDIGIRATVVKTWQGAEVIVPNASLISDNLINWTLSDDRRRMEIPVGVAYGSPTAQVIELLVEVARAHDEVLDDPEPQAIFTGFGDSALDFELRAWTRGNFVVISSDLRVGVDQTLAENGIEIPFPQRDLHLRTVGKRAAASLAGGNAKTSTNVEDDEESVPPESIGAIDSGEEKG